LHDRIIIKRDNPKTHSPGGIVLVENSQKKPRKGEVLAVGPGVLDNTGKLIPMSLKVGDRVLFGNYAGTEVEVEGDKYQIMRESDVVGVLEGEGDDIQTEGDAGRRDEIHSYYQ